MPISISREKLIEIVGGEALPTASRDSFSGVEYDSRAVSGGELFLALQGINTHGHQYLRQAFDRGAALFLVEDAAVRDGFPEPERIIVVPDSLKAFWKLANWWRKQLSIPILAITGSVGKTTVKEVTAQILLTRKNGSYSKKSLNNHVGLPYSICRISKEHAWAVLEMGMNHPGEIATLGEIAEPDIGVITRVAIAHLEAFESVAQIADAKCELVAKIRKSGTLILNADDPVLLDGFARVKSLAPKTIRYFGQREGSDAQILKVTSRGLEGISVQLSLLGERIQLELPVLGEHNAYNIAAAALAAKIALPEITADDLRKALGKTQMPEMRMAVHRLTNNRKLVDDSYNANPASMRAMLTLASELAQAGTKIGLILGDMRELGVESPDHHREIAKLAVAMRPAFIVAVGEHAELFIEEAKSQNIPVFAPGTPEAAAHTALKFPVDVILVKASRTVGLDRAVKVILEKEGAH